MNKIGQSMAERFHALSQKVVEPEPTLEEKAQLLFLMQKDKKQNNNPAQIDALRKEVAEELTDQYMANMLVHEEKIVKPGHSDTELEKRQAIASAQKQADVLRATIPKKPKKRKWSWSLDDIFG